MRQLYREFLPATHRCAHTPVASQVQHAREFARDLEAERAAETDEQRLRDAAGTTTTHTTAATTTGESEDGVGDELVQ